MNERDYVREVIDANRANRDALDGLAMRFGIETVFDEVLDERGRPWSVITFDDGRPGLCLYGRKPRYPETFHNVSVVEDPRDRGDTLVIFLSYLSVGTALVVTRRLRDDGLWDQRLEALSALHCFRFAEEVGDDVDAYDIDDAGTPRRWWPRSSTAGAS